MKSSDILALLRTKHAADVFVSECKNGPTQGAKHFRMDAWTMTKSWANACATGYEIKVSRSDFLGDKKWHEYLPLCNKFYFVAPKNTIKIEELHQGCGLIEVSANEKMLRTLVKAPFRDVEIPQAVYQYILMCRARIMREHEVEETQESRVEFWRNWLDNKRSIHALGHRVSSEIARQAIEIEHENDALRQRIGDYDQHREMLKTAGLDPDRSWPFQLQQMINKAQAVEPWVNGCIDNLEREIKRLKTKFCPEKSGEDKVA